MRIPVALQNKSLVVKGKIRAIQEVPQTVRTLEVRSLEMSWRRRPVVKPVGRWREELGLECIFRSTTRTLSL